MSVFAVVGDQLQARGAQLTNVSGNAGTAYGIEEVKSGQHEWFVKITGGSAMIGVSSDTKWGSNQFIWQQDNNSYAYYGDDGNKYSHEKFQKESYGNKFATGDIVGVHLDLNSKSISFSKNGKNMGVAYKAINIGSKYRLAITLYSKKDKVDRIGYVNKSEEEEKEQQTEEVN